MSEKERGFVSGYHQGGKTNDGARLENNFEERLIAVKRCRVRGKERERSKEKAYPETQD